MYLLGKTVLGNFPDKSKFFIANSIKVINKCHGSSIKIPISTKLFIEIKILQLYNKFATNFSLGFCPERKQCGFFPRKQWECNLHKVNKGNFDDKSSLLAELNARTKLPRRELSPYETVGSQEGDYPCISSRIFRRRWLQMLWRSH